MAQAEEAGTEVRVSCHMARPMTSSRDIITHYYYDDECNIPIIIYTAERMTKKVRSPPADTLLDGQLPSSPNFSNPERASSGQEGKRGHRKRKFTTRMREFNPSAQLSVVGEDSVGAQVTSVREKNNLAARLSRKRKKLYIELLQEQNTNLEMEVYALNEEIEMLRTDIFNTIMHADNIVLIPDTQKSQSAQMQSLVLRKLRVLCQEPHSLHLDTEINICLDSCIYRIGSSGSERKAILDILYTGFINRHLPNNYRFIMWSSLHTQHPQGEHWWDFLHFDFMRNSYQRFIDEQGPSIAFKGRQILSCAQRILSKKREIEASGQLFDQLIKDLRETMTPQQFARLFLFAQRSTAKRQLQIFQDPVQDVPDIWEGTREQHTLASIRKRRAHSKQQQDSP